MDYSGTTTSTITPAMMEQTAAARQMKHVEMARAICRVESQMDALDETIATIRGSGGVPKNVEAKSTPPSLAAFLSGEIDHLNAMNERFAKLNAELKGLLF